MHYFENKENSDLQKLQDDLERQYGPAIAQDIADRLRKSENIEKIPDYMDVKAMSELQEKYRAHAMMAVWRLKEWRRSQINNSFQNNLVQLEGVYLQRQCQDAIKLYRKANKTYFAMYRHAMAFAMIGASHISYAAARTAC